MDLTQVNWLAIIVSAVASMALGFLWYSPFLFANPWMKAMELTKEKLQQAQKKMGPMYALSTVGAILTALVLAMLRDLTGMVGLSESLILAFWIWLGFLTPVQLTEVIFGGKKPMVYYINTGYQLASVLAMAVVLSMLG